MQLILSCEHGGNIIPTEYKYLFKDKKHILKGHRGWDAGALILANSLKESLSIPLVSSDISRLLIDLNRSLHHRGLFSVYSNMLDQETKKQIIESIYQPYRGKVKSLINKKETIHLSIHSFTPVLDELTRIADIGLLYDPARKKEKQFCQRLKNQIKQYIPKAKIRSNYPYKGKADGFTTYLRKQYSEKSYCGIEIEINQKHFIEKTRLWQELHNYLAVAIKESLE